MTILYAGGLWTVFLIVLISSGYVWALSWPRYAYKILLILAVLIVAGSQILPETHLFRLRVSEGLIWWMWAIIIAAPILLYAMLVRWIKQKADSRDDPRRS